MLRLSLRCKFVNIAPKIQGVVEGPRDTIPTCNRWNYRSESRATERCGSKAELVWCGVWSFRFISLKFMRLILLCCVLVFLPMCMVPGVFLHCLLKRWFVIFVIFNIRFAFFFLFCFCLLSCISYNKIALNINVVTQGILYIIQFCFIQFLC